MSCLADATAMAGLLQRQPLRLCVLLAILFAVSAAALLRTTGSSTSAGSGSEPKPVSTAKVQLFSAWLEQLAVPRGARRDVTQTSCPTSVQLCVTAPETPRALISALRSELVAHGASIGKRVTSYSSGCLGSGINPPAEPLAEPSCGLWGSYRKVPFVVVSGQRTAYPQPSSWAYVLVPAGPYRPPKTEPLPPVGSLSSLGAVPRQWHVEMRCVLTIPGGCGRYIGHLTLRGSACAETAVLLRTLLRSNFNISQEVHFQLPTGARCGIGASRKLKPGGGDWFIVGSSLEDQPHYTSKGDLFISAM